MTHMRCRPRCPFNKEQSFSRSILTAYKQHKVPTLSYFGSKTFVRRIFRRIVKSSGRMMREAIGSSDAKQMS